MNKGLLSKASKAARDLEIIKKIVPPSMVEEAIEKYNTNQVRVNSSGIGLIFNRS